MAFMPLLAPLLTGTGGALASTILSVGGAVMQANAANKAAKANQAQLNAQAGQAEAASQHRAEQERRKADLMISRGLAVGAASGAGTSGISGMLEGIAGQGETAASGTLYEGTERAKGLRYQGAVGVSNAKQQGTASILGAVGSSLMKFAPSAAPTMLSGPGGLYSSAAKMPAPQDSW